MELDVAAPSILDPAIKSRGDGFGWSRETVIIRMGFCFFVIPRLDRGIQGVHTSMNEFFW